MTSTAVATLADQLDEKAVLAYLKLDPSKVETKATFAICERYGLDPLLKHVVVISGNVYVTRDGLLAVAHRSGEFDGLEVLSVTDTTTHHLAEVAVYRKGYAHPFRFQGRFPKSKPMAKDYGPEMAVKTAEVQALRRAFGVALPTIEEQWDAPAIVTADQAAADPVAGARASLGQRLNSLSETERAAVATAWQAGGMAKVDLLDEAGVDEAHTLIDATLDELAHKAAAAEHDGDQEQLPVDDKPGE